MKTNLFTLGEPRSLEDLAHHRLAGHTVVDVREGQWRYKGESIETSTAIPTPKWLMNDSVALSRFATSGAGLAFLPTLEGQSLVDRGELVRVLPDLQQLGATASLIWPESRHLAPRVRAFIDHVVTAMSDAAVA